MEATITLIDPTADGAVIEWDESSELDEWSIHTVTVTLDSDHSHTFDGDGVTLGELLEWEDEQDIPTRAHVVEAWNQHITSLREMMGDAERTAEFYMGELEDETVVSFLATSMEDLFAVSELPEWAESYHWTILEKIAADRIMGGEVWEAFGYVFRSY